MHDRLVSRCIDAFHQRFRVLFIKMYLSVFPSDIGDKVWALVRSVP